MRNKLWQSHLKREVKDKRFKERISDKVRLEGRKRIKRQREREREREREKWKTDGNKEKKKYKKKKKKKKRKTKKKKKKLPNCHSFSWFLIPKFILGVKI